MGEVGFDHHPSHPGGGPPGPPFPLLALSFPDLQPVLSALPPPSVPEVLSLPEGTDGFGRIYTIGAACESFS